MKKKPGIGKMIRAHFLTSIIAPIILGTLLAVYLNDRLEVLNFIIVLIIGFGLHVRPQGPLGTGYGITTSLQKQYQPFNTLINKRLGTTPNIRNHV